MTQRERSILIATAALVLALGAVLATVRFVGAGSDPVAGGDGQFISNDDDQSAAGALDQGADGAPAGPATADLGTPAGAADPTLAPPASSSTVTNEAPAATTTPTIATTASSVTTAAPTTETTAAPASTPTTGAATTASTVATTSPAGMFAVELEILALTNQLRADPAGPLARRKPMPACVGNPFYGITIDGATGHPAAVPALTLHEGVSTQLARTWSVEMDQANNLAHRSNASASTIYSQLGIEWSATGENIAWFSGYPDAEAARIFFEGWRESDTGHYCALVAGAFTHIGVGYHKGAEKSWATQNFHRPR
ncbi:MAG: CAP domain-containing protein [Actinomycetota bacterium]